MSYFLKWNFWKHRSSENPGYIGLSDHQCWLDLVASMFDISDQLSVWMQPSRNMIHTSVFIIKLSSLPGVSLEQAPLSQPFTPQLMYFHWHYMCLKVTVCSVMWFWCFCIPIHVWGLTAVPLWHCVLRVLNSLCTSHFTLCKTVELCISSTQTQRHKRTVQLDLWFNLKSFACIKTGMRFSLIVWLHHF